LDEKAPVKADVKLARRIYKFVCYKQGDYNRIHNTVS